MINQPHIQSRVGFTLLEVMFSILILGTGLIAIVSLFPVAGSIQRDTMDQVMAQNITSNAESYLLGRGLSAAAINAMTFTTNTVTDIPAIAGNTYANLESLVSVRDRGFPASKAASDTFTGPGTYVCNADYYWYPLFLKEASGNYKVFVFVQRRLGSSALPVVSNSSSAINAGDVFVDSAGVVTVSITDTVSADWHCSVVAGKSSFLSFTVIGGGVVR